MLPERVRPAMPQNLGLLSSHLEFQLKRSQKGQEGSLVCSPASIWALFNGVRSLNSELPQTENE